MCGKIHARVHDGDASTKDAQESEELPEGPNQEAQGEHRGSEETRHLQGAVPPVPTLSAYESTPSCQYRIRSSPRHLHDSNFADEGSLPRSMQLAKAKSII